MLATVLPLAARHTNAHSRRILQPDAQAAGLYNLTSSFSGRDYVGTTDTLVIYGS